MAEIIVITSGKGGVGKTTSVANIGAGLALENKRVVMIDMDIGLRNLDIVAGLENRIVYNILDVLEKKCRLKQALIRDKRIEGLYILPASQTRNKEDISPEQMIGLCEQLGRDFDYVLLDCPAGIERGFANSIIGADSAIVITTPEVSSVRDADRVIGLLEANALNKHMLIVNRVCPELVKQGDMLDVEDITDILAVDLLGAVPDDARVVISTNKGEPVVLRSDSDVGAAYRDIVKRILGYDIPFREVKGRSWLGKVIQRFRAPA